MPVSTKTLVRIGKQDSVFTVFLKSKTMKHNVVELACQSLHSVSRQMPHMLGVALALQQAVLTCKRPSLAPAEGFPAADKAMCVRGSVIVNGARDTVICGNALCKLGCMEMDTGLTAMHAALVVQGEPVEVTCIVTSRDSHLRNAAHFIHVDGNACINVATLNTGRRFVPHVQSQPCQSHYLRRKTTSCTHVSSFANLGLQVQTPTHTRTPLFDVIASQCDSMHCVSVFC